MCVWRNEQCCDIEWTQVTSEMLWLTSCPTADRIWHGSRSERRKSPCRKRSSTTRAYTVDQWVILPLLQINKHRHTASSAVPIHTVYLISCQTFWLKLRESCLLLQRDPDCKSRGNVLRVISLHSVCLLAKTERMDVFFCSLIFKLCLMSNPVAN